MSHDQHQRHRHCSLDCQRDTVYLTAKSGRRVTRTDMLRAERAHEIRRDAENGGADPTLYLQSLEACGWPAWRLPTMKAVRRLMRWRQPRRAMIP